MSHVTYKTVTTPPASCLQLTRRTFMVTFSYSGHFAQWTRLNKRRNMDMTCSRRENRESTKRPQSQRACSLSTTSVRSCYSSQWKPVSISVSYFLKRERHLSSKKQIPAGSGDCMPFAVYKVTVYIGSTFSVS